MGGITRGICPSELFSIVSGMKLMQGSQRLSCSVMPRQLIYIDGNSNQLRKDLLELHWYAITSRHSS